MPLGDSTYINPEAQHKLDVRRNLRLLGMGALAGGILLRRPLAKAAEGMIEDLAKSPTAQRAARTAAIKTFDALEKAATGLSHSPLTSRYFKPSAEPIMRRDLYAARQFFENDLSWNIAYSEAGQLTAEALRLQPKGGWSEDKIQALLKDQGFLREAIQARTDSLAKIQGRLSSGRGSFYDYLNKAAPVTDDVLSQTARELADAIHGGTFSGQGMQEGIKWDSIWREATLAKNPLRQKAGRAFAKNYRGEGKDSALEVLLGIKQTRVTTQEADSFATAFGLKGGALNGLREDWQNATFTAGEKKYDFSGFVRMGSAIGRGLNERLSIPFAPLQTSVSPGQLFPFLRRSGDSPKLGVLDSDPLTGRFRLFVNNKIMRDDGRYERGRYEFLKANKRHLRELMQARQAGGNTESLAGFFKPVVAPGTVPYWDAPLAFLRKFKSPHYVPNLLHAAADGNITGSRDTLDVIQALRHGSRHLSDKDVLQAVEAMKNLGVPGDLSGLADKLNSPSGWNGAYEDLANYLTGRKGGAPRLRRILSEMIPFSRDERSIGLHLSSTASFRASRDPERLLGLHLGATRRLTRLDVLKHDLVLDLVESARDAGKTSDEIAAAMKGAGPEALAIVHAQGIEDAAFKNGAEGLKEFVGSRPEVQALLKETARRKRNFLDLSPRERAHWEDFTDRHKLISIERKRSSWRRFNDFRRRKQGIPEALWNTAKAATDDVRQSWFTPNGGDSHASLYGYWMVSRLHDAFKNLGWGLPVDWQSSPGKMLAGMLVGRLLPLTLLPEANKLVNRITRTPGLRWLNPDLHRSHLLRLGGHLSHHLINHRHLTGVLPGLDFYTDNRTSKEQDVHERYADYTPVRKGRWWLFGSREPLFGEKVSYYLPSAARLARSDWQGSRNVNNGSWQSLAHFGGYFNPLNWGEGAYWHENAMRKAGLGISQSGAAFDPGYVTSGPLNLLFGWLKPRRFYNLDTIPRQLGGRMTELPSRGNPPGTVDPLALGSVGRGYGGGPLKRVPAHFRLTDPSRLGPAARVRAGLSTGTGINAVTPGDYAFLSRVSTEGALSRMGHNYQELSGLYGWMAGLIHPELSRPLGRAQLMDASRGYGVESRFWDQELGGVGGGVSDILRRFFPHRRRSIHDVDLAPNNMPDWLPEDLQRGNPQARMPMGALRLPGDAYCVSPDTLIETGDSRLLRADAVFSGTIIRTHKGNKLSVKKAIRRKIQDMESVYRIVVSGLSAFPLIVSEEHPVLTVTELPYFRKGGSLTTKSTVHNWVKAEDLRVGDYVGYPIPSNETHETPYILDLADHINSSTSTILDDVVYFGRGRAQFAEAYQYLKKYYADGNLGFAKGERKALMEEKGWNIRDIEDAQEILRKSSGSPRWLPRFIEVTPSIAALFGYWVAEGWSDRFSLGWAFHKDEDYYKEVEDALFSISGKKGTLSCVSDNGVRYSYSCKILSQLLPSLFGKGARSKYIPEFIKKLPLASLAAFLRALFNGDGTVSTDGKSRYSISLTSTSVDIAYGIRNLLLAQGIVSGVSAHGPQTAVLKSGKIINSGISYSISTKARQAEALAALIGYVVPVDIKDHRVLWFIDSGYIYQRIDSIEVISGIPEVIGFEVDIDDSFCVAGVATHNTKTHPGVKENMLRMRASSIGKTPEEIREYMLNPEGDGTTSAAAELGTKMHRVLQARWKSLGILEADEISVYDKDWDVSGHLDGILRMRMANGELQRAIVDIKTKTADRFNAVKASGKPEEENLEQIQFYMHTTGIHHALLTYVNRDDMSQIYEVPVEYDPHLIAKMKHKLDSVREGIRSDIKSGRLNEGAAYSAIDRYEILSDVAPNSDEFRRLSKWAADSYDGLTSDEKYRIDDAKKRLSRKRDGFELHDYRFKNLKLHGDTVHISKILSETSFEADNGRIYNVAGIKASSDKSPYENAEEMWNKELNLREGSRVRVLTAPGDERQNQDAAVLTTGLKGGVNIAKRMTRLGLAEEDGDAFSAPAVRNRFSTFETSIGGLFEKVAHLNNPISTKLLPVRSGLEQYERTDVYGKSHGDWASPWQSYIRPTLDSMMNKSPLAAAAMGAFFGSLFSDHPVEKMGLAAGGAAVAVVASLVGRIGSSKHNPPIPRAVRQRRDIEEYYDNLTYLKYKFLAAREATLAYEHEGINTQDLRAGRGAVSADVRHKLEALASEKQALREQLRSAKESHISAAERKAISESLADVREQEAALSSQALDLGEHALKAVLYRDRALSTLRGSLETGDTNAALRALPQESRHAIEDVVRNGTKAEKQRLYDLLPTNQKAALGSALGQNPKKLARVSSLEEYFAKHPLPKDDWEGWDEDLSLELIEAKDIADNHHNLDPMDFGIYPGRIEEATLMSPEASINSPAQAGSHHEVLARIEALLAGHGFKGRVRVERLPPSSDQRSHRASVTVNVKHKREHAALAYAR